MEHSYSHSASETGNIQPLVKAFFMCHTMKKYIQVPYGSAFHNFVKWLKKKKPTSILFDPLVLKREISFFFCLCNGAC